MKLSRLNPPYVLKLYHLCLPSSYYFTCVSMLVINICVYACLPILSVSLLHSALMSRPSYLAKKGEELRT